jgi:hypothetical protein
MLCLLKVVTQSHQSTLDCHLTQKCVCWRWPFEHVQSLNTPVSYDCNDPDTAGWLVGFRWGVQILQHLVECSHSPN